MPINEEKFEKIKQSAEEFYKQIVQVYCPYFREQVNFNIQGLNHIKMKGWNKARSRQDQIMRLKLVKLAPQVIRLSNTLQGYFEKYDFVRKKINNLWDKVLTRVTYFEFIAVIEGVRIRIIVKVVTGGQKFFWSIIPFWRMNKEMTKRLLFSGRPEND